MASGGNRCTKAERVAMDVRSFSQKKEGGEAQMMFVGVEEDFSPAAVPPSSSGAGGDTNKRREPMTRCDTLSQPSPNQGHSVWLPHHVPRRTTQRRNRRRKWQDRKGNLERKLLEVENWEEEIKESPSPKDCREEDASPYDVEDVVGLSMLQEGKFWGWHCGPVHGSYNPSVHHMAPVKWVRQPRPVVCGQFVDAEE